MNIIKSFGAVVAGILVVVLLSVGTDFVLEKSGVFPPPEQGLFVTWMLALAFTYRTIYGVLGAWVVAKLAPAKPMRHVLVTGIVGTAVSIIGVIVGWDLSAHWYPIALAVTALPGSLLGGKLAMMGNSSQSPH